MNSKFHQELCLKTDRQTIAAGGPCNWQDGDEWALVKDVEVTQGSVVASSGESTTVRRGSDQNWSLDVSSSGKLTSGPAQARAIVLVRRADGTVYQYPWSDDVQLVQLDEDLESPQIQGNITPGFNKDYAGFLVFAFPANQQQAREWLRDLVDQVATTEEVKQFNDLFRAIYRRRGRRHSRDRVGVVQATWMNLAFTYEGLENLGLAGNVLDRFPAEFREGMRSRAELIGDVGENDPKQWPNDLGSVTIHALMVVSADSDEDRNEEVKEFSRHASERGLTLVWQQDGMTRPEARDREHFGFRDGISQPGIRGLTPPSDPRKVDEGEPGQDLIAPGEFILGYPLEAPPPASVRTSRSPAPAAGLPNHQLTFTHNGSYLVFRRLRQDVKGFRDFVTAQAAQRGVSEDLFAATLVGRYQSGAPLEGAGDARKDPGLTNPDVIAKDRINNFVYSGDPDGIQVPHTAHIRKVNPRDQVPPGKRESRRRRILRRGLPFGESYVPNSRSDSLSATDPQASDDRGLCFVSYQSSIRDQFEFIQRQWVNNRAFPNPGDGVDPIASQSTPWVTTTGGEYFFAPSIRALEHLSGKKT